MKIFILLATVGFVLVSSKPFWASKREKRAVCPTTTYDKPKGNIVSHGDYGLFDYTANQDCTYVIKVESPSKLYLSFHHVALEGNNPECRYDYVKIVSTNEKFCGNAARDFEFDNVDSDFTIKFRSDGSIQFGGFNASYRIEPLFQAAPFIANTTSWPNWNNTGNSTGNATTSWPNWNTTTSWPNWNITGNSTGNTTTSWPNWNTTTSWPNWNITGNSTWNTTTSWPNWNTTTSWPNWNITGNSTWNTTTSWPNWNITGNSTGNITTPWPYWNNTGNSTGNTTTSWPNWNTTTSWPSWNITTSWPSWNTTTSWPSWNTTTSWPSWNTTTSWPSWNTTTSWPSWNTTTSWPSWNTTTSWPNLNITGKGTFPSKDFATLINMLNGTYVNVLVLNYQGYNNVDL